jgi:cobalt/nickel transport system permease protein
MHLEVFSEGDSLLHKLDPRVKIILFGVFSILCITSSGIKAPLLNLFYPFCLILIGRIKVKPLLSRIFFANIFITFIWLFIPFSYSGNSHFKIYWLKISYDGLKYALSITLKCNAMVLATITLLSTSSLFSFAHAMIHFKVPNKLVTIFFLFYRYITVIHEEYLKIRKAVSLRGFVPGSNFNTYKTYAYIIGGMIIKSYERAEDIYKAMLCRGFKGIFPLLEHFEIKKYDKLFFIISISIIILLWVKG